MKEWLENFINSQVKYMTEEQVAHFKQCAIKLNGKDNLIEAFDKYSYNDFIQIGVLSYEEIQILDTITEEIVYMKEDEELDSKGTNKEYDELKEHLSNKGISLVDYEINGDSGIPIISLHFNNSTNKWIYQKPIEKSNSVRQKEFDSFEDARKFIVYAFL